MSYTSETDLDLNSPECIIVKSFRKFAQGTSVPWIKIQSYLKTEQTRICKIGFQYAFWGECTVLQQPPI